MLSYIRLTKEDDCSSPSVGITNLYDSISSLGDGNYLKSEDVKSMLLCPKLADDYYKYMNEFVPNYELNPRRCHFIMEQASIFHGL